MGWKILKRYNKSDGLAGNETNRAAGFVDNKGNVWIGTDEGSLCIPEMNLIITCTLLNCYY